MRIIVLFLSLFILLGSQPSFAERIQDAKYSIITEKYHKPVYLQCDIANDKARIVVRVSDTRDNQEREAFEKKLQAEGLEILSSPLTECKTERLDIRIKLSSNRIVGQGCGSVWSALSLWVNHKKILRTEYNKCMYLKNVGFEQVVLLDTTIEIDTDGVTFCQEYSDCQNFVFGDLYRDSEEYDQDLTAVELARGYRLTVREDLYKNICTSFAKQKYFTGQELQDVENLKQQDWIRLDRQFPWVSFINTDLNGDGVQELAMYMGEFAAHWAWDVIYVFPENTMLNEENKGEFSANYLVCSSDGINEECTAREGYSHELRFGREGTGLPNMNNPQSAIWNFEGIKVVDTMDYFQDEILISLINKDFSLKPICRLERLYPNF